MKLTIKMKVVFNVKLRNVYRAICMNVGDLNNPLIFSEKSKLSFVSIFAGCEHNLNLE